MSLNDDDPTARVNTGRATFPIVGVGASAGGLEALEQFFDHMPNSTGMAFVIVQHLSPDFKSLMNELLSRHTKMSIHRVEDGMPVEPNGIYLIPPKKNMILVDGRLMLTEQDPSGGLNLPIDIFFRSLAQDAGEQAVAVVLSGTGSDGSRGIQDIHKAGGAVMVQSIESAGFDGMPRNAIATGLAHVITSPKTMGMKLQHYLKDRSAFKPTKFPEGDLHSAGEMATLFSLFRSRFGIDFTLYRQGTIQRRIERRMQLVRCTELEEYVERLRNESAELHLLYRDLLVEVTQFFRDRHAFSRLQKEVIPVMVDRACKEHEELRIWIAGCATGEEAYSFAIMLYEYAKKHSESPTIKIFATDVHQNSLEAASAAVYSPEAIRKVPEDLQAKYFTLHGSLYHVNPEIRKMVIFAPHNISHDPPFTRIDLVSCRNVLIYLQPEVQQRVLSLFHFGLKVDGYLFLGSSESLGGLSREFETVDQHWRIFRKLRNVRLHPADSIPMAPPLLGIIKPNAPLAGLPPPSNTAIAYSIYEDLLDQYLPPSFLINSEYELVHSFGEARKLLSQPKGRPTLELLKMVEGDLRVALSTALHRASRANERVILQGVTVRTDDGVRSMQVSVEPHCKKGNNLFLVCLETLSDSPPTSAPAVEQFHANDQAAQRIVELERELDFKKESLQTTVEELESSNEELQSTNEEMVAANEELQSTNEELHSVNEELYTVNAEYQRKIGELTELTADMDNLIRSTEIATIFLDRELRIRRFTPTISAAFNIMEQDIGRPIDQFAYHFETAAWTNVVREVIATGEPQEAELHVRDNNTTYLKRIRPYRTSTGEIDGVVITFTDVSMVSRAKAIAERQSHLERVTRNLKDFAYAVSHDLTSPLRHIKQAVEKLQTQVATSGNPEIEESVATMAHRTSALEEMVHCLLEYTRVNTRGEDFHQTDLNLLLEDVLAKFPLTELRAEVTQDVLPTLSADAKQLRTVLYHLIDNALKYSGDQTPRIHIGAKFTDNHWILSVTDHGIGIDPQYLQSVFIIFRRLQSGPPIPGNGLGLALCRGIVERHGGTIWVESEGLGKGTSVYVRWDSP